MSFSRSIYLNMLTPYYLQIYKKKMLQAVKMDMMCDLYRRTFPSLKHFIVLTFYI